MRFTFTYTLKLFIATAFVLLSSFTIPVLQDTDTNAKFKASLVVQFTKNIEWPDSYKEGNFIVGVLGNSALLPKLNEMAASYKAGNQTLEIIRYDNAAAIGRCHMLIIPTELSGDLGQIQGKLKNSSTLIITEKPGLAKLGANINFVIQESRLLFELNKSTAEKANLKVSAQLSKIAVAVY